MPLIAFASSALETTTSTGVGNVTLAGALPSYWTFQAALANENTSYTPYRISSKVTGEFEVGIGRLIGSNVLQRLVVHYSSNGNAAVSLGAGPYFVYGVADAREMNSLAETHKGAVPPTYYWDGMQWLDTSSASQHCLRVRNDATNSWPTIGCYQTATGQPAGTAIEDHQGTLLPQVGGNFRLNNYGQIVSGASGAFSVTQVRTFRADTGLVTANAYMAIASAAPATSAFTATAYLPTVIRPRAFLYGQAHAFTADADERFKSVRMYGYTSGQLRFYDLPNFARTYWIMFNVSWAT